MSDTIRWGILGTGSIAHQFAGDLRYADGAELAAVGSRTQEAADAFGDEFGIPRCHGTYEALADDPGVDVIYVATPHSCHKDNTILCLEYGKAVLCEKPFAINRNEAETMAAKAREQGLFLMEAMWSRFFPLMRRVRKLADDGAIGEVGMVTADFGFRAEYEAESRLFDPAFGGGSLLDVGVYAVSFASMLLGEPHRVEAMAELGKTGVDEQCAIIFGYEGGQLAALQSGIRTTTPHEATVIGAEGYIRLFPKFWNPTRIMLARDGKESFEEDLVEGRGFHFEVSEVMRCLDAGETESPIMPLDESIAIMDTMDRVRAKWGLKYPME